MINELVDSYIRAGDIVGAKAIVKEGNRKLTVDELKKLFEIMEIDG